MLAQMKEVKMIGLAPILAENLQKQAEDEVDISMKDRNAMAGAHTLSEIHKAMCPFCVLTNTSCPSRNCNSGACHCRYHVLDPSF